MNSVTVSVAKEGGGDGTGSNGAAAGTYCPDCDESALSRLTNGTPNANETGPSEDSS
jgi:hypothetical protein